MTMSAASRQNGIRLLAILAAAAAGCAGNIDQARRLERRGQHHMAYEIYRETIASDPTSAAATAGLRRTALRAAAYWQRRADRAVEAGQWRRAAQCHLEVLRIKPDDVSSILTVRGLAKAHPHEVAEAYSSPAPKPQEEPPAGREERPTPTTKSVPIASTRPHRQAPSALGEHAAADARFIMVTRLSRDDGRYPKQAELRDGLAVKLKDTDPDPLDADVEVYLGKKRLGKKLKDLPPGSVIVVSGWSGRRYRIVLVDILDETETVTIGLRPEKQPKTPVRQ